MKTNSPSWHNASPNLTHIHIYTSSQTPEAYKERLYLRSDYDVLMTKHTSDFCFNPGPNSTNQGTNPVNYSHTNFDRLAYLVTSHRQSGTTTEPLKINKVFEEFSTSLWAQNWSIVPVLGWVAHNLFGLVMSVVNFLYLATTLWLMVYLRSFYSLFFLQVYTLISYWCWWMFYGVCEILNYSGYCSWFRVVWFCCHIKLKHKSYIRLHQIWDRIAVLWFLDLVFPCLGGSGEGP